MSDNLSTITINLDTAETLRKLAKALDTTSKSVTNSAIQILDMIHRGDAVLLIEGKQVELRSRNSSFVNVGDVPTILI